MTNVAFFDAGSGSTENSTLDIASGHTTVYVGGQFYMTSAQLAAGAGYTLGSPLYLLTDGSPFHEALIDIGSDGSIIGVNDYSLPAGSFTPDEWHTLEMLWDTSSGSIQIAFDGVAGVDNHGPFAGANIIEFDAGAVAGTSETGQGIYVGEIWVGTSGSSHDLLLEDWSSGDFSNWAASTGTVITDPVADPPAFSPSLGASTPASEVPGRVFIAFDDGPLEPNPTWTCIDQGTGDFPDNFVSGYDIATGRQTLLSQTDTGTATVYINDYQDALFDPRNVSSPYFGLLDGKQILLRLYDPVADAWEDQFRGFIDDITWDMDGSAVGADGKPINASIKIECVDLFDFLAGYGLTPGLDGITPQTVPSGTAGGPVPTGMENGVYYAATAGTVADRIIEILTDVGIDSTRYLVASGNTKVIAVKYDPDESALQALRDAADAEFPFIANIYCDRHGMFAFRGRYSRFAPDDVAAEPGSDWDFTRWAVGDGAAITADPTRAQMRVLSFGRNRSDLINVAICWPQGMNAADMPNQVFADTASITAYGKHSAPPISDLLTADYAGPGTITPATGKKQCALFAELLVKNQKDPRENISALQVKAIDPADDRAEATWALITRADISHIVNVAVGYPGGTGLSGDSPEDDYYIEYRQLRVRPLNPVHDYAELDLEVSPAVWSMDTQSVFPAFGS